MTNARTSAPGRLSALSFLLKNRSLSIYTLNAPHSLFKGLTPLGMATYLNRLDFVTALLDEGDGLVLLDGVDSHRATPIMCTFDHFENDPEPTIWYRCCSRWTHGNITILGEILSLTSFQAYELNLFDRRSAKARERIPWIATSALFCFMLRLLLCACARVS